MKHSFVVTGMALSLLLAGTAGAAEKEIGKGSAGMLFTFGGLSNLSAGEYNGGLGAKYFVTPNVAVRGSLAFTRASHTTPANPGTGETGIDGETTGTRFGLGVGGEYHLYTGRISPYVGALLSVFTTSTSDKPARVGTPPATPPTTDDSAGCESVGGSTFCGGTSFGAALLAGIEFFPFDRVSLGAEYQLGYAYSGRADQKISAPGVPTATTHVGSDSGFGIASTGLLTLTFYFL